MQNKNTINRDFVIEIKLLYNNFTKVEKKIADYVINNIKKVPFMGICELAQECGVGETSVFRFCKTMKLTGYQEFKMRASLNGRDDNLLRTISSGEINISDDIDTIADKILDSNISVLKETRMLLNADDIYKVVDMIIDAQRVFLYGVGASLITALECMNKFMRITSKMLVVQDSHMQLMQSSTVTDKDLVIVFSYSGDTKDIVEVTRMAKKNNAKIVGISRYKMSELSKYTDVMLLCSGLEDPVQGGSLSAKISQVYLINMLYTQYYKKMYPISKQINEKTSHAIMKKLY